MNRYYEKNLSSGTVTLYYYLGGRMLAYKEGSTLRYVYKDHLTGTSITTDTSGNVVGTIKYKPYGEARTSSGTLPAHKFTGQRLDDVGLYYYGARYYDPALARFISADSVVSGRPGGNSVVAGLLVDLTTGAISATRRGPSSPQSFNRYSYVLNNPLKYIDPNGNQEDDETDDGWGGDWGDWGGDWGTDPGGDWGGGWGSGSGGGWGSNPDGGGPGPVDTIGDDTGINVGGTVGGDSSSVSGGSSDWGSSSAPSRMDSVATNNPPQAQPGQPGPDSAKRDKAGEVMALAYFSVTESLHGAVVVLGGGVTIVGGILLGAAGVATSHAGVGAVTVAVGGAMVVAGGIGVYAGGIVLKVTWQQELLPAWRDVLGR